MNTTESPWVFQDASDLANEVLGNADSLFDSIQEEDPATAIKLCDKLAAKLSELRSELSELAIPDVGE